VYGPRQRPDLAIRKFVSLINAGKKIPVFGDGSTARDYTYINDILEGVLACTEREFGYEIFNLGESQTVKLSQLIELIEQALGKQALIDRQGALLERFDELGGYAVEADVAQVLAGLGFKSTDRDKPTADFSGGWQMRIALAKMLVRLQLEDHAPPEIEAALAQDPRLPMAHFLQGEIWLYKMDAQRALPEFQQELAINPSVWLVYWRLGDTYMRLKQYDEAEKALLAPFPAAEMTMWPVDKRVGNVKNNDPSLIEPVPLAA